MSLTKTGWDGNSPVYGHFPFLPASCGELYRAFQNSEDHMPIGDVWQINLKAEGISEICEVALHYFDTNGVAVIDFSNIGHLASGFDAALVAKMMAVESSYMTYLYTQVFMIAGSNPGIGGYSYDSAGVTGTTLGTDGTIERAVIIQKRTPFVGRKFRGRNFWPAPCLEAGSLDGEYIGGTSPDAAAMVSLKNQVLAVVTPSGLSTYEPCIFHRATSTYTALTSVAFSPHIGIQRRRRQGMGS